MLITDCHIYENRGIGIYYDNVNLHQSNINGCHISYCSGGGVVVRGGDVRTFTSTDATSKAIRRSTATRPPTCSSIAAAAQRPRSQLSAVRFSMGRRHPARRTFACWGRAITLAAKKSSPRAGEILRSPTTSFPMSRRISTSVACAARDDLGQHDLARCEVQPAARRLRATLDQRQRLRT